LEVEVTPTELEQWGLSYETVDFTDDLDLAKDEQDEEEERQRKKRLVAEQLKTSEHRKTNSNEACQSNYSVCFCKFFFFFMLLSLEAF
jgi:hypothetical protein